MISTDSALVTILDKAPVAAASSAAPQQANHLSYLDGFRALMALYVVIHHASHYFGLAGSTSRLYHVVYMASSKGHYAVNVFIVLSGFCLALPVVRNNGVMREGYWEFVRKRVRRILPPYYIALGFSLLTAFILWLSNKSLVRLEPFDAITRWDLFTHLFLIQDAFRETANSINHALWSISVEWRIYFLFPLLIFCSRRFHSASLLLLSSAIAFAAFIIARRNGLFLGITGINPHYLVLFSMGILAAKVSYSKEAALAGRRNITAWRVAFFLAGLLLLVADWRTEWEPFEEHLLGTTYVTLDVLTGVMSSCLLIVLASGGFTLFFRFLSWRALSFTGTFAYSIYLIHAPLLEAFYAYVIKPLHMGGIYGLLFMDVFGVMLIVGFSYLFFLLAEKPFMKRKPVVA